MKSMQAVGEILGAAKDGHVRLRLSSSISHEAYSPERPVSLYLTSRAGRQIYLSTSARTHCSRIRAGMVYREGREAHGQATHDGSFRDGGLSVDGYDSSASVSFILCLNLILPVSAPTAMVQSSQDEGLSPASMKGSIVAPP